MVNQVEDNLVVVKEVQKFDSYEADLLITDGEHELLCYYDTYPPIKEIKIGTLVTEISSFFAKYIMRTKQKFFISKEDDYYSYSLCGELIQIDKPIVKIFNFNVVLDAKIPNDIRLGEFIEFKVQRLEVSI